MHLFRDNGAVGYGRGSYVGLTRDRIERDCTSPSYGPYSLSSSGRDSACHMSRDSSMNNGFPCRTPSSRLLASGSIDQRIMKQSTEDCRRLLQQVCDECPHSTARKRNNCGFSILTNPTVNSGYFKW